MRNRKEFQRRKDNYRNRKTKFEMLEFRALMANNFLAGTAFVDTNSNGQLDTTEAYLSGVTIELRQSVANGNGLISSTVTDSKGAYYFGNLAPGNYQLVNLSKAGFASTASQAISQISPVLGTTANTIDVSLVDPADLRAVVDTVAWINSGLGRDLSYTLFGFNDAGIGGQFPLRLQSSAFTPNLTNSFLSICTDLYNNFTLGTNSYVVNAGPSPTGTGSPHNAERIAYLYNHYGRTSQGANGAVALQIAVWELLYDAGVGDIAGPAGNLNAGNFRLNTITPSSETANVISRANAFLLESVGKAESAVFLNVPLPSPTTPVANSRQGTIVTGSFNFGNRPEAKIGDYVWLDSNANGQQDGSEPGVDNIAVRLLNATGTTVLATTTTGDNPNLGGTQQGYYEFKGLAPGSYVVQFFTGAGYDTFTTIDVGADASDSDANPLTGRTAIYTLVSGQFNQTVDAGLKPIDLSLTKTVSNATPAVGDNVTFTLTVNNANGFSTATGVKVTDALPAGLTLVSATPSQGTFSGNIWDIGILAAGQTVALALTATVTTGGTKTNYAEVTAAGQVDIDSTPSNNSNNEDDDDQVSLTPTAAIGDYVWLDVNADGQQDSGEPGIDNLMVQLLDSTSLAVLGTTTTGDNPSTLAVEQGYYEFKGLAPGSYIVQFYTGGGYNTFTTQDSGADASDSDADVLTGQTGVYVLASGDFNRTVDAGLKPIDLSLSKSVSNSTPAVGENVTFTVSVNNANGFSTATGVQVKDVLPAGLTLVSAIPSVGSYVGNTWTIGSLNAGQTVSLVVTATVATGGTKSNYAEVTAADQVDIDSTPNNNSTNEDDNDQASLTPTAALGDYVWLDRNANGQQDPGEEGLDGLAVLLLDASGTTVLATTTTGENPNLPGIQTGYYEFKGLAPGSYVVQFSTGLLYDTFTTSNSGSDVSDSDANESTGKTGIYVLASGDFNQTVDAGVKPIDLSLMKTVDNSSPSVGSNVTFTISVTNANGYSTATGVKVNDVLPAGLTFVSATPSVGAYAGNAWTIGTLAAGQTVTLTVTATVTTGGSKTNYAEVTAANQVDTDSIPNNGSTTEDDDDQASLTPTAAIGDYVWLDRNVNGQQDSGEFGIDNLTVQLFDSTGTTLIATTFTGDDPNLSGTQQGYYEFKGLVPGDYVIQFFTGSGYDTFTLANTGLDASDSDADATTGRTGVYTLASGDFNQTVDAGLKPIDLSLTKAVSNAAPAVGDNIDFTIKVNNANGFSTATNVEVNDVLPAGLTFVSSSATHGSFSGNTWTIGTINAGQTVTLTITATVATGGLKTNYAEVSAAGQIDLDSTPNNNSTNEDDDDQVSLNPTAAIGDYVWLDRNANGQQDSGEPGISDLIVNLLDATGTSLLATTTTGDNPYVSGLQQGYYEFKGLTPGSYVIQFTTGQGYDTFTSQDVGSDTTDSDANVVDGKTAVYVLASGEFNQTVDAGLKPIDLSLTKSISNAAPAVGANVTYTLTVNNANGFSTATGVEVKDVLPAGMSLVSATPSQGSYAGSTWTIGTLASNQSVTLEIVATVLTGGTKTNYAEVIAAGQLDLDSTPNNISNNEDDDDQVSLTPTAAIGDYVWLDSNANGQQDSGEPGIDGVTVKLLDATGTTVLFTTVTNDDPNIGGTQPGYYEFKGLTPGSYIVQFFTGSGYDTFTNQDVGADTSDSDANTLDGKTAIYVLASGEFNRTVDAGLKPIDLSLTKAVSNASPAVGSNVTYTLTVANANGFSTATGVEVKDVLPVGLSFVSANPSQGSYSGNTWTIGTLAGNQSVTLQIVATVTTGGTKTNYAEVTAAGQVDINSTPNNNSNNEDDDDQVSLTPTAAIGDYVWLDVNADGQQDSGEPGIDNLMVQLLDSTSLAVLGTTTTGDNPSTLAVEQGYYEFKGLAPGSYIVQFYTGGGYNTFTTQDSGADASDSDADVLTGKTGVYVLASGDFNRTVDAGLKPIDLSLSKSVSNSTPAVGENVTFTVSVNNANGFSTATGVQVKDVLPAGLTLVSAIPSVGSYVGNTWTIGSLNAGQTVSLVVTATVATGGTKSNYAEVTAADQVDIDSTPNNNSTNEDDNDQASLTPTAALGDYVWLDRNANGQQDPGEEGLDGLAVLLLDASGTTVLATTTTGENPNLPGIQTGYYEFKGLAPGSYVVQFSTGLLYDTFTTSNLGSDVSDSDANASTGKTGIYVLASGDFNQTVDAGVKPIDLSLTKTVDNSSPSVGSNVTFTISVTNANGYSTATGVKVNDVLPAGLTFVSATPSVGAYAGNAWTIGTLAAGQTVTLTVTATVTTGGTKTNYAEVTAANQVDTDSIPNNGSTTEDDDDQASLTPTAAIGDYVWLDRNVDGQQDVLEFGIDNLTVQLFDSTGTTLIATTITGDNPNLSGTQQGYYEFKGLVPGDYVVQFFTGSGYDTFTLANTGLDASDSDADAITGRTGVYTLASGDFNQTVDAGLRPIDLSLTKAVSDTTPTIGSNVTYTLTVNNANGFSKATGVEVQEVLPVGLTLVSATPSQGTYSGNTWVIGDLNPNSTVMLMITATVVSGGTLTNYAEITAADQIDFDSTPNNSSTDEDDDDQVSLTPSASIGNYVWVDVNNNGLQDEAASFGVNGVTVTLFTSGGTQVGSTTTASDGSGNPGYYLFTDINPGAYYVVFTAPAGQVFTTTGTVLSAGNDSNADSTGKTANFNLVSGVNDLTIDAGLRPIDLSLTKTVDNTTPTVGSNVVYTLTVNNANGFSNATGVVVKDVLPSGMTFVGAVASQGTFSANTWTIGNVNANQSVTLTISATVTNGGTKTNYAEVTAAGQFDIDSTPNNNSANEDDDDQVSLTPSASIGNYVWVDVNNNGLQDEAASFGVNGVTVTLFTSGGTQVGSTTTASDGSGNPGYYLFTDINPGAYYVVFTAPAGQVFTTTGTVLSAGNDSNADSTGKTANFNLVSGVNDLTIDAGLRPIDLSLTKTVNNAGPTIGTNVNFTLTVNNASGFSAATGVAVRDVLPAGLTLVSSSATQGAYVGNIWTIGNVTAGQTVTLTITATVATGGTKTNYAEVTAANQIDIDSTPNNNSTNEDDDDQVTIIPFAPLNAKIDIEKTTNGPSNSNSVAPDYDNEDIPTGVGVPVLTAGTAVTWTYRVANTGNVAFATSDIVIVDDNGTPSVLTDDMSIANGKITFASVAIGNADNVLDPNEVWLYRATGIVETALVPGSGAPTVIDFQGGMALDGPDGNVLTFSSGGISVKASAFSRSDAGVWSTAYLGSYGGGLGVTDGLDGSGAGDTHTVDNMGGSDNYVLFEFSQSVIVDSAALGYVVGDSDMTVWIGTKVDPFNNHAPILSDAYLSSLGFTEINLGANVARNADLNSTNYAGNVLIIAAKVDEATNDDRFKIQNVLLKSTAPATYANKAVINVPNATDFDMSHYRNPSRPAIDIEKTTNGPSNSNPIAPDYDNEDAVNGAGVPVLTSGTAVTWTYRVSNTGNVAFATSDIVIVDDNGTPTITTDDMSIANGKITFASVSVGDADNVLEPGEVWLYQATGTAQTILIPGPGTPTTIDFQGNMPLDGTDGNILTFSSGGISVKASAFSRTDAGAWSTAYLGSYGGGLGVTDNIEGSGANDTHTVDNIANDNYVLFEFSQSVIVDSALLGYVVNDSDLTVWIGTMNDPFNNHLTLSDSLLNSLGFREVNLTTLTGSRNADLNSLNLAGNVLVIAAKVDEATNDDRFKIQNVLLRPTVAGIYENKGVITVPGATDFDLSHYKNPDPTICVDITTTGNSAVTGTIGNILTFGSGNISVRASAFSRTDAAPNTWNTAFLGSFSGGLGVTDGSENGSNNTHTVDNSGGRDNYVLFEFSQPVLIDKAILGYVVGDSDITVWIGTRNDPFTNHITLSDSVLSSLAFTEENNTTLTSARTADINAKGVVGNILVIAANAADTSPEDFFKIAGLKVCTPSKTKFFVVNDSTTTGTADRTFEYTTSGTADENYVLHSANTAPRGAAATAAGDKVWVVDANRNVYVYNNSGGLLGSWTASLPTGATPEGIATNGTDIWIVTSDGSTTGRNTTTERVFRFSGATSGAGANRLSGSQAAASSFQLHASNTNPKDLVTDGTNIWVVDDGSTADRVFRYDLAGAPLGNWMIDAANSKPTGITLDPANVSNLWIVDNGTRRIYQYNGATALTTGSTARPATTSFALSAANTNPQGIADPPVWDSAEILVSQDALINDGQEADPVSETVSSAFNAVNPTDVNGDGVTSPLDVLLVVNRLNGLSSAGSQYHDVNNDGVTSPLDALLVINQLDSIKSNASLATGPVSAAEQVFAELGEGESDPALDDLVADVAAQWGRKATTQPSRLRALRVK